MKTLRDISVYQEREKRQRIWNQFDFQGEGVLKTGFLLCSSVLVSYKLYSKEEVRLLGYAGILQGNRCRNLRPDFIALREL